MYSLGVLSGMALAWVWYLVFSKYAITDSDTGLVNVRCKHCGTMYKTGHGNVRVDDKCSRCI